ncbi:hypothetical protein EVAR_23197_1 [Eumeta japonica]|uniref:Uncharacterized protein n=1 Tax=Eumeta variegata TaxID=151549 RepID=A0A4C1VGP7_EUMVA|nr:hypothetical protein EVAR_23197_1 [Eumeta japonica]
MQEHLIAKTEKCSARNISVFPAFIRQRTVGSRQEPPSLQPSSLFTVPRPLTCAPNELLHYSRSRSSYPPSPYSPLALVYAPETSASAYSFDF